MRFWRWLKRTFWHEHVVPTDAEVPISFEEEWAQEPWASRAGIEEPPVPDGVDLSGVQSITLDPTPVVELPTTRDPLCLFQCQTPTLQSTHCVNACALRDSKPVDDAKAILEQAFPPAPEKEIRYPEPAEQSVTDWVNTRLGVDALNPDSLNKGLSADLGGGQVLRYEVRRGFSMSYLREIVARAQRKDPTLTDDQLAAARSRGLL